MSMIILFTLVVTLALAKKNDTDLASYARYLSDHITGNANFPTLQAGMTAFDTLIQNFSDAIDAVKHGPPGSAEIKDALRVQLESAIKFLASNCIEVANGDAAILTSSGLTLKANAVSHDNLAMPVNFFVTPTDQLGTVKVKFYQTEGARTHMLEMKIVGEPEKTTMFVSDGRNTEITSLQSGKVYEFRLKAIGKGDIVSPWTSVVTCNVL